MEKYKDSDLTIVGKEEEWFVVLGDYRLTDVFKTKEKAIQWCDEPSWKKIMLITSCMIEWSINHQKELKK